MTEMEKYATQYQQEHRKQGEVSKINNYSFWFTTTPKGNAEPKTCILMKSWFLDI